MTFPRDRKRWEDEPPGAPRTKRGGMRGAPYQLYLWHEHMPKEIEGVSKSRQINIQLYRYWKVYRDAEEEIAELEKDGYVQIIRRLIPPEIKTMYEKDITKEIARYGRVISLHLTYMQCCVLKDQAIERDFKEWRESKM